MFPTEIESHAVKTLAAEIERKTTDMESLRLIGAVPGDGSPNLAK